MDEGELPERPQEPIEHAVLQWPPTVDELSRGKDWAFPKSGHIDAANPPKGGWVGGVAIVAVTYLFDVEPQGGGTCYFPGSHRAVHSWMRDHPDEYRSGENLQGPTEIDFSKSKGAAWRPRDLAAPAPRGPSAPGVFFQIAGTLREETPNLKRVGRATKRIGEQ